MILLPILADLTVYATLIRIGEYCSSSAQPTLGLPLGGVEKGGRNTFRRTRGAMLCPLLISSRLRAPDRLIRIAGNTDA